MAEHDPIDAALDSMNAEEPVEASWQPPAEVPNHVGEPLHTDMDFFGAPPREIGELMSASSTLTFAAKPWNPQSRLFLVLGVGVGGLLIGLLINYFASVREAFFLVLWPLSFFIVAALIAWFTTRFKHSCTYVGKEGVCWYECSDNRENITREDVFEFKEAAELRTSQTRHYLNGGYQRTEYNFTWSDDQGRTVFTIASSYQHEEGNPPAKDLFHFARMGEIAWSYRLLDRAQAELDQYGCIQFNLGGEDFVRVGVGFIELSLKGQSEKCTPEDIAELSIANGEFTIRRKDAKKGFFSSKGIFKISYGSMANAKLFLLALEKLMGYQFD